MVSYFGIWIEQIGKDFSSTVMIIGWMVLNLVYGAVKKKRVIWREGGVESLCALLFKC
jgi:hypothetical protein